MPALDRAYPRGAGGSSCAYHRPCWCRASVRALGQCPSVGSLDEVTRTDIPEEAWPLVSRASSFADDRLVCAPAVVVRSASANLAVLESGAAVHAAATAAKDARSEEISTVFQVAHRRGS